MCLYIYRDKERFSQLCKYRARAKVEGFICMVRGPSVVQAYHTKVEEFLVEAALAPVKVTRMTTDRPHPLHPPPYRPL